MGHLTYDDRLEIQHMLAENFTCAEIGDYLHKHRSTITREIKQHRKYKPSSRSTNLCVNRNTCDIANKCAEKCYIRTRCRDCYKCTTNCPEYKPEGCKWVFKSPYVCNGCRRAGCKFGKWMYSAKQAQLEYSEELRAAREGISLPDEDLKFLNSKIVPLIKKGVSVPVACQKFADSMPISITTMYKYINNGYLDLANIDLRMKVRRPMRSKSGPYLRVDKKCHYGRSYNDYLLFTEAHPDYGIVQMDSVIGRKGGKTLLTLLFKNCDLQLYILRDDNTAATVSKAFDELRNLLEEDFSKVFQIILTDRGGEFTDPVRIETNFATGELECNLFYCDPLQSNQKSNCERNHELLRYIFPKNASFDKYTQEDITLAMNHINSYPRKKLNWKAPIDLFEQLYGKEVTKKLGLEKVAIQSIELKPSLLTK